VITGTDDGIWRRIRLIPWNESIPADKKRPQEDVVDDLKAEGPAILNWLLEGLHNWQADRKWTSTKVMAATQKYREAQDFLGPFLAAECEEGQRYRVSVADLYATFETWCVGAHEDPISKKELGSKLRDRGFFTKAEGDENVITWQGIRLKVRVHTNDDSISTPTETTLAEDMENGFVSTRKPQEIPSLDFNSGASEGPPALPPDISGLSMDELRTRAGALAAFIDGTPPRPERLPDYERLTAEIATRERS
jgi:phage/plasmid-associated DNA primase